MTGAVWPSVFDTSRVRGGRVHVGPGPAGTRGTAASCVVDASKRSATPFNRSGLVVSGQGAGISRVTGVTRVTGGEAGDLDTLTLETLMLDTLLVGRTDRFTLPAGSRATVRVRESVFGDTRAAPTVFAWTRSRPIGASAANGLPPIDSVPAASWWTRAALYNKPDIGP